MSTAPSIERLAHLTSGWRVTCEQHKLDRTVESEGHATNLLALHLRRDHSGDAAPAGSPATLNVSKAADYLMVCWEGYAPKDSSRSEQVAYYAALDMWEALTGLTGDAALAYARTVRDGTKTTAALIPF